MSKITLSDITETLAQEKWEVISTSYQNLSTEMIFRCPEGHNVFTSWGKLRTKRECPVCNSNQFKQTDKVIPKKKGTKRFLALDQQTKISGYSIFDGNELIKYGTFETNLDDEIARDNAIKNWLLSMIQTWQPDFIALEGIQFQDTSGGKQIMGVTVFETLARLQGILMETCFSEGVEFEVCPTNTWRAHNGVKGKTRSDKKTSAKLIVKQKYDISVSDDIADGILIGKYISDLKNRKIIVENWE